MGRVGRISGIIAIVCLLAVLAVVSGPWGGDTEDGRLLLSDYPKPFGRETMIVIPEKASQVVVEGARGIACRLEELTENEPPIKNDTALAEGDEANLNLLLIGTPGSNALLEQIYSLTDLRRVTSEYPGQNKGILQMLENPWNPDKAVLMVAGSDELGVRAAIEFLLKDEEIGKLNEEKAVIEFADGDAVMIPVDILNSVMDYVKQNHSDAAAVINQDISWTRTSQTVRFGYTKNVYAGDGWTVTIGRTIVPEVFYDARAEYGGEAIVWVGRIENGVITESSYTAEEKGGQNQA